MLAALLVVLVSLSGGGGPAEVPDPWHTWRTLRMKARASPLFHGQFELVRRQAGPAPELETKTQASFLGRRVVATRTLTTFEVGTGRTTSSLSESRKHSRRYLFGEDSYTVETRKPVKGEAAQPDRWPVASSREFTYPRTSVGAPRLYDYYGMLLHLRDARLHAPGDEVTVHVATAKGPQPFRTIVGEKRESERRYVDLPTGRECTVTVRELRLRVVPADPASADEGFLRMEGETEIWVEAESKTPLEINGKVPKVGRVRLLLSALG